MPPVVGEAWVEKEPDSLEDEVKEGNGDFKTTLGDGMHEAF